MDGFDVGWMNERAGSREYRFKINQIYLLLLILNDDTYSEEEEEKDYWLCGVI